jgi:ferredoxin
MAGKTFIALDRLTSTLEKLSRKIDLWIPAPSQTDKQVTEFMPYQPGMVPVLNRQSTLPPKKVLFPRVETLLRFEYTKDPEDPSKTSLHLDDQAAVQQTVARPALVFGARPCDARGFLTLDRSFCGGSHVDPYYRLRRDNTLLATLVCREGDGACFCSSVGGGPADMEGSDFRITPIEGGYLMEALNEKAEALSLMESLGDAPTELQEAQARQVVEEASRRHMGHFDFEGSAEAFPKRFEARDYWREMAAGCLGCGACTYVCPTCHCFTITDEMVDLKGERLRSWDSCMFYRYTLEASGHNPRPTKLERYRNRLGHKFCYIPEKFDGWIGCSGCGRCIRSCPVSIDIRKVVEHLKEEACECA